MTLRSAVHTTDDVITYVRRYLSTTQQDVTVDNVVGCIAADRLMMTLAEHNRICDKRVEDAVDEVFSDTDIADAEDRGYQNALDDIALLAEDESNTHTPAA